MLIRPLTCDRMMRGIAALAFACMIACFFWCAPRVAWAGEYDDAPVGVLTLCDDPFAVDCGHSHSENDDPSQVCHSASPICHPERSEESPGTPASPEEDFSLQALPFAQDDMGGPSDILNDSTGIEDTQQLYHLVGSIPSNSEGGDPSASPQDDMFLCHSEERSDEESHSATQTPSTEYASSTASNEDAPIVSIASSEDVRVIVDDEGLGRHEAAVVLAEVRPGISRPEFEELVRSADGLSADDVTDEDLAYGLVRLVVTDGSTVLDTVSRIVQISGFISAQPNYIYSAETINAQAVTNDTYRTRLWALSDVDAYGAWDIVKCNNAVAVAIIDTGVVFDHPDLAANIIATHNSLSAANTVEDTIGHGTHVAGIIAGIANNKAGVAGVSYNANLVVIKASPYKSNDFDTAAVVRAYSWLGSIDSTGGTVASHYNVRVVNMSLGGLDASRSANMVDDALIKAMIKARDELGILTVASAGNGNSSLLPFMTYPGDSDACLSVMNLSQITDEETGQVILKNGS